MTDWRHHRTGRLWLDVAAPRDEADLFAIHSDPASWTHFPQGRHTDRSRTPEMVAMSRDGFASEGLGYWCVRDAPYGPVVGWGGCGARGDGGWWNLAYRFDQSVLRRGYATELGAAALSAAAEVAPERPVVAYLLEHNHASRRTAERLGLGLVWRGPDVGNVDPDAVRLVFTDRELPVELLARVTGTA